MIRIPEDPWFSNQYPSKYCSVFIVEYNVDGKEETISLCNKSNRGSPEFPIFTLLIRKSVSGVSACPNSQML